MLGGQGLPFTEHQSQLDPVAGLKTPNGVHAHLASVETQALQKV